MEAAGVAPEGEDKGSSGWQKFVDWLYLPNTNLDWTRRLTALDAFFILLMIWTWCHGGPGPANIPAWRLGPHLLTLPLPPEPLSEIAFCFSIVCAIAMLVGLKQKIWAFFLACVIGYYGAIDWVACGAHFVVLEWIALVAFLFERKDRSATRRIIQASIVICYLYAALQKLTFPDFRTGNSFEAMFADGWCLGSMWRGVLPVEHFGHGFWLFMSWATIFGELIFALGLCFPRTRKFVAIGACLFHLGISIFLDKFLTMFSIAMWAGLSTFFDKSKTESAPQIVPVPATNQVTTTDQVTTTEHVTTTDSVLATDLASATDVELTKVPTALEPVSAIKTVSAMKPVPVLMSTTRAGLDVTPWIKVQTVMAAAFIAVLILFPLRIYFYPGRPVTRLSFFDRSPWSFSMYMAREETTRIEASYQDAGGQWHPHKIKRKDRWGEISSDNETYALANYIFKTHPDATRVKVETDLLLNGSLPEEKILERERNELDKEITVRYLPARPGMHFERRRITPDI